MFKAIPVNTSIHSEVLHNGKAYKYSIRNIGVDEDSDGEDLYRVVCRWAKFTQDFLLEDVDGAIESISDILTSLERDKQKIETTRFGLRLTIDDKKIIEENAKKYGYSSVSEFLKTLGRNPEKFMQIH